ncbi:MAG: hypothetical protein ACJA08_002105 [Cyclobacteriaceae bacterium]|jgi:hypothetical protein
MKTHQFPFLLPILISTILTSCEKDNIENPEEALTFADSISGIWLKNKVFVDGVERTEWDGFQLSIEFENDSSGIFNVNASDLELYNGNNEAVEILWPVTSTWTLKQSFYGFQFVRSDQLEMDIDLQDNELRLTFYPYILFPEACNPIEDPGCPIVWYPWWVFTFEKLNPQNK